MACTLQMSLRNARRHVLALYLEVHAAELLAVERGAVFYEVLAPFYAQVRPAQRTTVQIAHPCSLWSMDR